VYECVTAAGVPVSIPADIVSEVAYLGALFDSSKFAPCSCDASGRFILPHELESPYLQAVLTYAARKDQPQLLLTKLPCGADVSRMTALIDFLALQKPAAESSDLDELILALKDVHDGHDRIARRVWQFHSARSGRVRARNAASAICVGLASGQFVQHDATGRMKLFNACMFILSHFRTFRRRLRHHLWALIRRHCASCWTAKQWDQLTKWTPRPRRADELSDSDTQSDADAECHDAGFAYDSD